MWPRCRTRRAAGLLSAAALLLWCLRRKLPFDAAASTVPLVSLSSMAKGAQIDASAALAWRRAAALGVARLEGHGVEIESTLAAARSLFRLPLPSKLAAASDGDGFGRGYIPLGGESGLASFLELKEGYCYGDEGAEGVLSPLHAPNRWPDGFGTAERSSLERFYREAE